MAEEKWIDVPNMVLVGSFGRNDGKTTLACRLVRHLSRTRPVVGLKVISVAEKHGQCQHGAAGCGLCTSFQGDFRLAEDDGSAPGKDTALLKATGAQRAFLLSSLAHALPEALAAFLAKVPQNAVVVCESNSLRTVAKPGVFFMAAHRYAPFVDGSKNTPAREGIPPAKASAKAVFPYADRIVFASGGAMENGLFIRTAKNGVPRARLAAGTPSADIPGGKAYLAALLGISIRQNQTG